MNIKCIVVIAEILKQSLSIYQTDKFVFGSGNRLM